MPQTIETFVPTSTEKILAPTVNEIDHLDFTDLANEAMTFSAENTTVYTSLHSDGSEHSGTLQEAVRVCPVLGKMSIEKAQFFLEQQDFAERMANLGKQERLAEVPLAESAQPHNQQSEKKPDAKINSRTAALEKSKKTEKRISESSEASISLVSNNEVEYEQINPDPIHKPRNESENNQTDEHETPEVVEVESSPLTFLANNHHTHRGRGGFWKKVEMETDPLENLWKLESYENTPDYTPNKKVDNNKVLNSKVRPEIEVNEGQTTIKNNKIISPFLAKFKKINKPKINMALNESKKVLKKVTKSVSTKIMPKFTPKNGNIFKKSINKVKEIIVNSNEEDTLTQHTPTPITLIYETTTIAEEKDYKENSQPELEEDQLVYELPFLTSDVPEKAESNSENSDLDPIIWSPDDYLIILKEHEAINGMEANSKNIDPEEISAGFSISTMVTIEEATEPLEAEDIITNIASIEDTSNTEFEAVSKVLESIMSLPKTEALNLLQTVAIEEKDTHIETLINKLLINEGVEPAPELTKVLVEYTLKHMSKEILPDETINQEAENIPKELMAREYLQKIKQGLKLKTLGFTHFSGLGKVILSLYINGI